MSTKKILACVLASMAAVSVMAAAAFAEAPDANVTVDDGEASITIANDVAPADNAAADAEKAADQAANDVAAPEAGDGNAVTTGTDTAAPAGDKAPATDKDNPDSGVEGVAAVLGVAAVAAGALVVAKKRK